MYHPERVGHDADLASRCDRLGVTLIETDLDGCVLAEHHRPNSPLEKAVVTSNMFRMNLMGQARQWANQPTPSPVQMWQGCWLLPLPRAQRRRRVGYHVVVMLTPDLCDCEQFYRLCDSARVDRTVAMRRLQQHTGVRDEDVKRWSDMFGWMTADLDRIQQQTDDIDTLSQQLAETYEELNLVYKLSAHMTVSRDSHMFLEEALNELQQVVGMRWLGMQLTDDEARLDRLSGSFIHAGDTGSDDAALRIIGRILFERFGGASPTIIEDVSTLDIPGIADIAERLLIVPITIEGKPIALLFGADKIDGSALSSVDSKLVTSTSQNMAIFLDNAMLYEDMQDMFMGTLHSLVSSIDAKDSYTCGHSERVAWLSRQLAESAGLDPYTVERVYLSGLVHDVGKIGVPEAVLRKPGKLTNEEFDMIKAHPEIGVRILKDIRQMQDLLPGVLHHHERYDGRGYPYKIAGQDIPLFGRLICLADSFDAMSSTRTYRQAMPLEKVLEEISNCAGTQFDPELAKVFVKLDFGPYHRMVQEHQQRKSPLDQCLRSSA
ncbi:HD domain-containing protein [Planctomycetales bacterium ZRK34]|nr:HD domain-containing protein [Planctomycetales bacterium ZRK34]